jgi:hypothetical protein
MSWLRSWLRTFFDELGEERRTRTIPIGEVPDYTVASKIVDDVCRMSHAAALTLAKALRGVREGAFIAGTFLTDGDIAVDLRPDGSAARTTHLQP